MFGYLDQYNPNLWGIAIMLYLQGGVSVLAYACWHRGSNILHLAMISLSVFLAFVTLDHIHDNNRILFYVASVVICLQWIIYELLRETMPRVADFSKSDGWRLARFHLFATPVIFVIWVLIAIGAAVVHYGLASLGWVNPI